MQESTTISDTSDNAKKTYFSESMIPFPDLENSKIRTQKFLDASNSVVSLLETLGKVFVPVKHDLNNNIEKISKKYEEDVDQYAFLEDMILAEKNEGGKIIAESIMWLTRGLNFFWSVLDKFIKDEYCKFSDMIGEAYSETLERYHGWLGTQLFSIMVRYSPDKKEFRKKMALKNRKALKRVPVDIKNFITPLAACVEHLISFYSTTFDGLYDI